MITTLLFDVDGVLLIGDPWNQDLAPIYGITDEMLRPFFTNAFPACLVGKADLKAELTPYLARWGWPHSTADFLDYWFRHHTLNTDLLQTIKQLRSSGLKCYLATQQECYRTDYILRELAFAQFFDGTFSSVDIGYMKDDTLFFETLLRDLDGCQPAEVLFWDDSAQNVAVARSAGLHAEVYSTFANFLVTMHMYRL